MTATKCFQCHLPIDPGEMHTELDGEIFHASPIQCFAATEQERYARIAESFKSEAYDARTSVAEQIAAAIRSGK